VVEPATKLVKKDNEMVEVADGIRGRILPFELVQRHHLADQLAQITEWQSRLEAIDGELEGWVGQLDADEQEVYLNDDNTALNKKPIQADAKRKGDTIEPETKVKLQAIVALYVEQTALTKNIKTAKIELESATQRTIEAFTDDEVIELLEQKWIEPVFDALKELFDKTITDFIARVNQIDAKYATPYNQLDAEIAIVEAQLASLVGELTGDESAIIGLSNLIK
jgi:type I restriction enzyme M protein